MRSNNTIKENSTEHIQEKRKRERGREEQKNRGGWRYSKEGAKSKECREKKGEESRGKKSRR